MLYEKIFKFLYTIPFLDFLFHLDDFTDLIYNMSSQTVVSTQLIGYSVAVGGERQADRKQRDWKPHKLALQYRIVPVA